MGLFLRKYRTSAGSNFALMRRSMRSHSQIEVKTASKAGLWGIQKSDLDRSAPLKRLNSSLPFGLVRLCASRAELCVS
jgi:hypothetical protein